MTTQASQTPSDFMGDHLSVRMVQARGDDSADDLIPLQDALDYACANRTGMLVPPGVYKATCAAAAAISSATNASAAIFTVASAPADRSPVIITGFTGSWLSANGLYRATRISATTFSIPINSSGFGAVAGSPKFAVGLYIKTGNPGIYGQVGLGSAQPAIKFYGSGDGLTIGDSVTRVFAAQVQNIGFVAANGATMRYMINVQNMSEVVWPGIAISATGTGTFQAGLRLSDADGIAFHRLTIFPPSYAAGSVGVLFDDAVLYGNLTISFIAPVIGNLEAAYDIRNLQTGSVYAFYTENCKYGVRVDNTSHNSVLQKVTFHSGEFNTSGTGAPSHAVLSVTSAAAKTLEMEHLRFDDCRIFLSGGVSYPFQINLASTTAQYPTSRISLHVTNCAFFGVLNAIVDVVNPDNITCNLYFENNYAYDNTAVIRTPDVSTTTLAKVFDATPVDGDGNPLYRIDPTGAVNLYGSTGNTMVRPGANYYGRGVIAGTSIFPYNADGYFKLVAGGGIPVPPSTSIPSPSSSVSVELCGFNTNADMDRTIVFCIAGTEIFRIDGGKVLLSNAPLKGASGTVTIDSGLSVTGSQLLSGNLQVLGLTASLPTKTNASKVLVSGAIDLAAEVTGQLATSNGGTGANYANFAALVAAVKAALGLGIGDISGLTAALAAKAATGTVTSGPSAGAAHTHTI
ncbi:MAG: hypothetical protein JWN34_2009 [Bryobacterales bacterium]|nr:hypothetical protein [Bryobacterales bacterium]